MVEVVNADKVSRIRARLARGLEAVFFGEHGPDRLVGWLVRANESDQALITTVFYGRLAFGPEGARGDYQPPEREAWRQAHRWRLELAWGLMVLLQDQPGLAFVNLILIGITLAALVNNIVGFVMEWFA